MKKVITREKYRLNMKILFCGTMLPRKFETEITSLSSAANQFQHNLINEMRKQGNEVRVLSYIAFPVKQTYIEMITAEKETDITYIFKQENVVRSLLLYQQMIKSSMQWADIGISYNVIYPWFGLSKISKRKRKTSVLVLADFYNNKKIRDLRSWLYYKMQVRALKRYDKVVGLTANMQEWLLPQQQFVLMEGGIHWEDYEDLQKKTRPNKTVQCMFSGVLSNDKGVSLLLEALKMIPDEIRLVITGKGPCEQEIRAAARKDHRIVFLGQIPFEEYLLHLKESDILLNPRDMHFDNNEYNFPSKFLEYLATGNLIISTKFTGWEKFEENACFVDSDPEKIAEALSIMIRQSTIMINEYFDKNRTKAREFSWSRNVEKILKG